MRAKFLATVIFLLGAQAALAIPTLQLDIVGGTYDEVTETIVSSGSAFTLVAVLTPKTKATEADLAELLATSYFISAAVSPIVTSAADLGSFDFDETTIDATSDMGFGTPPLEAGLFSDFDAGDLPKHGIFETFFAEFEFKFDASQTTAKYNTADDPGGPDTSGSGAFYALFEVDVSNLAPGYSIHFDLYNKEVADLRGPRGLDGTDDIDVGDFAPFSHGAESRPGGGVTVLVPEPGTLVLIGGGLALFALGLRRRRDDV